MATEDIPVRGRVSRRMDPARRPWAENALRQRETVQSQLAAEAGSMSGRTAAMALGMVQQEVRFCPCKAGQRVEGRAGHRGWRMHHAGRVPPLDDIRGAVDLNPCVTRRGNQLGVKDQCRVLIPLEVASGENAPKSACAQQFHRLVR